MRLESAFSAADSAAVARVVGGAVDGLEPLHGGRNSRVFRARFAGGTVVVKQFYRRSGDPRRRDQLEVDALRFLGRHDVDAVPRVLGHDPETGTVAYDDVAGETFPPAEATAAEIDEIAGFIAEISELRDAPDADRLPLASEGTLSLLALGDVVERRLERLRRVAPERPDLTRFLTERLEPARRAAEAHARRGLDALGIGVADELARDRRVLSPSDLGFHNALRRPGGGLVFVDFEYFGWDEPSKLVSDFVLHPAMELSLDLRLRFARRIDMLLADPGLWRRVEALHPLHAVRWALILLNEYVPDDLSRRRFAGEREEREAVLARQLEKAGLALEQIDLFEHATRPHEH